MANSTPYPLRQALDSQLQYMIQTTTVPMINAALTMYMTAAAPNTVPQFVAADIVNGDLLDIDGIAICVTDGGEKPKTAASRVYSHEMFTKILVKATQVGDNMPEDYKLFFSICVDNIRDLLTQAKTLLVNPVNPTTGLPILPGPATFTDCKYRGATPKPLPVKQSDKVTYIYGYEILFRSLISINVIQPTS